MEQYPPTPEQQNAIDLYLTGRSLVIQAGAGTGKTSTLVFLSNATPSRRIQFIAFNRPIVEDARTKFPRNVSCNTAHSLAYRAIINPDFEDRQRNGKRMRSVDIANRLRVEALRVDNGDGEQKLLSSTFLAGLALRAVTKFCQSADPAPTRRHVPWTKALADEANRAVAAHLEPVVRRAWSDLSTPEGGLPFTTSTAMAVYLKLWQLSRPIIGADVILYDEAQDASPVMVDVVARQADAEFRASHGLRPAQLVWVGDSCQPRGTLVQRVVEVGSGQRQSIIEEVPIEQIQEGDLVVSYDVRTGHLHRRGNRVLGVSERKFIGSLVQIDAGLKWVSNYTPDHHCVAKLGPAFKGKHLVYLMRRAGTGESYRIGRAAGSYTSGFGPLARAKAEGADALWILSAHATAEEAATAEALASHRYGIPMMLFRAANNRLLSQDAIETFWSTVGDLTSQATECLRDNDRDVRFPLWRPGQGNLLMSRATTIRACNLMTGMHVPVTAAAVVEWAEAKIARRKQHGSVSVYSMTVENDHTYVGDGIVTHNCQQIYGFTGAINALETVGAEQEAFLTQSFRFGPAVAAVANHVLSLIPSARLRLTGCDKPSVVTAVAEPDAILTRTNATAVRKVLETIESGRRPHLVGGGQDVIRFAEAAASLMNGIRVDHPELACFEDWAEVQDYVEEDEQGGDLKLLVNLIDEFGAQEIIEALKNQPSEDEADLVVSTAHKSKGREWDTVQIADDFPEDRLAKGGDEAVDELRLLYVAVTRAKLELDVTAIAFLRDGVAPNPEPAPAAVPAAPRPRAEVKRSAHVGIVGGTITVEAGCVWAKGMTTRFGYTYLTQFVTADGDVLKAFLDDELESGTVYSLTARVKEHGEFRGVAETTINYVDFEESSGAVDAPEAPVGVRVEA